MLTVRIHGAQDLRIETLPNPSRPLEPGMVALSGGFTGICGTDVHLYYAPESYGEDFTQPAALTRATWPQILGHEFSGVVVAVGAGVTSVRHGDRVAVFPYHFCGKCAPCQASQPTDCELMAFEGIQGRSGGMTDLKLISEKQCFVLPETVGLDLGALVEPMAVGWHGVGRTGVGAGDSALILGGGPIGIGVFFALRAKGVGPIIVSEPSETRRAILRRVGVDYLVDPLTEDLPTQVQSWTDGKGVSAVLDVAGSPEAFVDGMRCLAVNGSMVTIALYERPIPLTRPLLAAGRTIRSSAVYDHDDYRAVISAMGQGLISLEGDWTQKVGFDDVAAAIEGLRAGTGAKILVRTPDPDR